jgi:hypothetical protein
MAELKEKALSDVRITGLIGGAVALLLLALCCCCCMRGSKSEGPRAEGGAAPPNASPAPSSHNRYADREIRITRV